MGCGKSRSHNDTNIMQKLREDLNLPHCEEAGVLDIHF